MPTPEHGQTPGAATSAWIISIGTELTLGQTVDTNSAWLSRQLAALGIRANRHLTVPDELGPIRDALREAAGATGLILISGGLGPTEDDLTRQALADAAGEALELDESSLAQIRNFFTRRGREMPAPNRVQAMIPRGGRALPNLCGTAPGVFMRVQRAACYVMPGVPSEMRDMFEREVLPALRRESGGRVVRSRRLQCTGAGESEIGARIQELMTRGRNPEVGTTAEMGVIGIRINATADSVAAAESMLDQAESQVRERLSELVFGSGEETLAHAVGVLLAQRGESVCCAESCTGGLIGAMLTDVAGSSRYFFGAAVTYSNAMKTALLGVPAEMIDRHGAVCGPVAEAMARGARERFGADFALAATGIAGPGGGTDEKPVGLVYIALATPTGVQIRELRLGDDSPRATIRARAAGAALNLLRLHLIRSSGP
ncbi:MAG: competence/damage-inducible protein A [Phycisphaerae bacterium]